MLRHPQQMSAVQSVNRRTSLAAGENGFDVFHPLVNSQQHTSVSSSHKRSKEPRYDTMIPVVNMVIDDDDAVLVIVFPRGKESGGLIDGTDEVKNPRGKAADIFSRMQNAKSKESAAHMFLDNNPVSMEDFQLAVRTKFLELLHNLGIQVTAFESFDGDEVFLKLCFKTNGQVMQQVAEMWEYKMPYREDEYAVLEPFAALPGERPEKNKYGTPVVAFAPFTVAESQRLQSFSHIDAARLLRYWLNHWVSLDQMVANKICTRYFVAATHDDVCEIVESTRLLNCCMQLPNHKSDQLLKGYFGEGIAFCFFFLEHLTNALCVIAPLGLIHACVHRSLSGWMNGFIHLVLGLVWAIWAAVSMGSFQIRCNRLTQLWGLKDAQMLRTERARWDPNINPQRRAFLTNLATLTYILLYFGLILYVVAGSGYRERFSANSDGGPESAYMPLIISAIIYVGSWLWGKIARLLINFRNFRTEDEWNTCMTYTLATVKIPIALWPFFLTCFLQKYVNIHCEDSFDQVVHDVWGDPQKDAPFSEHSLYILKTYYTYTSESMTCVYGCYPSNPAFLEPWTDTNCLRQVKNNLWTFFIIQALTNLVMLVIPVLLTRWAIRKEELRVKKLSEDDGGSKQPYTWLQYQAKCHELSPYEYYSWGGSAVEDYMEMAIGHALVVFFGVLTPVVSFIALIGNLATYRLRLFRMLFVTCRPFPHQTEGIGAWKSIFTVINTGGVICNVGLVATFLYPIRTWSYSKQTLLFLFFEHLILLLREFINFLHPDEQEDIQRIEDQNHRLISSLKYVRPFNVPPEEKCDTRAVDLSLNPYGVDKSSESDGSEVGLCC